MTKLKSSSTLALALAGGGIATVVCTTSLSMASDHQDTDETTATPFADIADVFAFTRPEDVVTITGSDAGDAGAQDGGDAGDAGESDSGAPTATAGRVILVMTVNPSATASTLFSTAVNYDFNLLPVGDTSGTMLGAPSYVQCRFQAPDPDASTSGQPFICSASGYFVSGFTGQIAGAATDPVRAWAGLRSDPAFGDTAALAKTVNTGASAFADAGVNAFAGQNVLAIVLDIDTETVLFNGGPPSLFAVSASTEIAQ